MEGQAGNQRRHLYHGELSAGEDIAFQPGDAGGFDWAPGIGQREWKQSFGPQCFEEREDGLLLFEEEYTNEDHLLSWLLGFGDKARVLEPESVRNAILGAAENMTRIYGIARKEEQRNNDRGCSTLNKY